MSPALIFDCDGVLADTERDGHRIAFNRAFEELGIPLHWDDRKYAELVRIGGGKERIRHALSAEPELTSGIRDIDRYVADIHARKSTIYQGMISEGAIPPRPGIRRLVDEALAEGWQLAVASTSARASVEAVLRTATSAHGFSRFSIYAGDVVGKKKPAPDIYELAVADLGVRPQEVVVIEDSAIGLAAARGAGLATIVTVSTYTAEETFEGAALVVDSLGEPGAETPIKVFSDPQDIRPPGYIGLHEVQAVRIRQQEEK